MAGRERPLDLGNRLGQAGLVRLGQELRDARLDRGLSLDEVGRAIRRSAAEVSRIERGRSPNVPAIVLFRFAAVVGLDLSVRLFPGASILRDVAHVGLLADFRASVHPSLRWATEVPLPSPGDQRAWDALVSGPGWRYGVEAETAPRDAQALNRRLGLKARDGGVDGVLLVLRANRRTASFLREAALEIGPAFPVPARRAASLLAAGLDPGGSAVVLMPWTLTSRVTSRPSSRRVEAPRSSS